MKLTLEEYQKQAVRTSPDLGSHRLNMFHMKSGIKTEQGELLDILKRYFAYGKAIDKVNFIEEIGDICWYASNKNTFKGIANIIPRNTFSTMMLEKYELHDLLGIGEFLVKEDLSRYKPNDIFLVCKKLCEFMSFDFEECLYINIAKLYKRFPEKFDESFALNRDLDGERKLLENGIN